jgi:hypothetical protein
MKHRTPLIGAVALATLGAIAAMMPMTPTQSASPSTTISIQDLHRQVDVKSLPVLRTEDFQP